MTDLSDRSVVAELSDSGLLTEYLVKALQIALPLDHSGDAELVLALCIVRPDLRVLQAGSFKGPVEENSKLAWKGEIQVVLSHS